MFFSYSINNNIKLKTFVKDVWVLAVLLEALVDARFPAVVASGLL